MNFCIVVEDRAVDHKLAKNYLVNRETCSDSRAFLLRVAAVIKSIELLAEQKRSIIKASNMF